MNNETELIREIAIDLIEKFDKTNKVCGGINGPYDDPESCVRNLSHLAVICSIEITKYNNTKVIPVQRMLGNAILRMQGEDGLWIMRDKAKKDKSNGVIGHAWLNEGLIYLYKALNDEVFLSHAIATSQKHKFNHKIGLWERPTEGTIDNTLNHQLWYAATLAELLQFTNNEDLEEQIHTFLEKLPNNISINRCGRIRHSVMLHEHYTDTIKQHIKNYISDFMEMLGKPSMAYKENGYHIFNLMALARLYCIYSSETFFSGEVFNKVLHYINRDELMEGLESKRVDLDASLNNKISDEEEKKINIYGFPYNVPGFELMYISKVFPDKCSFTTAKKYYDKQINYTYNKITKRLEKGCHDKTTVNYRIYELYRYLEIAE